MRLALIALVLALAACSNPARVVVLQHPETKQTVECRIDPWGSMDYGKQVRDCVSAYQQAGFKVVGDSGG